MPLPEKETFEITVYALGETMNNIRFEPEQIEAPAGKLLKVKLINKSTAIGMFHNIVFCTFGKGQKVGFKGIAAGLSKNYIPDLPEVISGSKMLEMGDSTTFEFPAPAVGQYNYICTFPGHYSKMIGVLTIKK
jgi:azurin